MISITTPAFSPAFAEANAQPLVLWDNALARATIQSATLPAANPRSRAVAASTADYWGADATPDTLRGDFGSLEAADCCFIDAHTLSGKTVKVQRLVSAVWTDTATIVPTNNDPILMIFPSQTSLGWGIHISAPAQVGVLMIGSRLTIPGGVTPGYSPVWASHETTRYPNTSMRGHFLGSKVESAGASMTANFMPIPHDFALNTMRSFRSHYNNGRPFVWAAAPSYFPEDVAYCWADKGGSLSPRIRAGGELCDLSMSMRAYRER